MSVREIIVGHLKKNGYDGLYNTEMECACELNDLAPCVEMAEDCEPGYKQPCDCAEGCDWHIGAEKMEEENEPDRKSKDAASHCGNTG